jgi:prevent-host-death family protein
MMEKILPTMPISELRKRQAQVLELMQGTPIVLTDHGDPAGVLVKVDQWNDTAQMIRDLQGQLELERHLRLSNQRYAGYLVDPSRSVRQDEYERMLAEAGLSK